MDFDVDLEFKLIIDYNDGLSTDAVLLSRIHTTFGHDELEELENECLFSGHLEDNQAIKIRVNGCPLSHTFQVNLKYLKFQYSMDFSQNLTCLWLVYL